jgi:putative aldouronate transport system substrate-binding protein
MSKEKENDFMLKRIMAMFIVAVMLVGLVVGCSETKSGNKEATDPSFTSSSSNSPTDSTDLPVVTIDHLYIGLPTTTETFDMYLKDSPVYKELVRKTGVEINEIGVDFDQAAVRIASGDLGDLITIRSGANNLIDLVESGNLLALNDLVDEYAPNIKTLYPERWNSAITDLSADNSGNAYVLPVQAGNEGSQITNGQYLYTVRWDLYKKLGYPKMENPDDLLKVLESMMELEPTNTNGKKVYGASFYVSQVDYFGFINPFAGTYGMSNLKGEYLRCEIKNQKFIYDFLDIGSPYWMASEYYNKAYRMGILDPDSFTQTAEDFHAKIDEGEIICVDYIGTAGKFEERQLEKDPETLRGYANIPVEGCMFYQNGNAITGWGVSHSLGIPTSSKYPDRIMQMLAYTFDYEGTRLIRSGIEGIHWDYVNGVPTVKDEVMELKLAGGDEWRKTGICGYPLFENFSGIANAEIAPDGYKVNLFYDDDYLSKLKFTPWLQEFCEYYNVSWPNEIFHKLKKEGKMYDLSTKDSRVKLTIATEEIDRIDAKLLKIAIEAIPKLVSAENDEEFEKVKAETIASFKANGAEKSRDYWQAKWDESWAKYHK